MPKLGTCCNSSERRHLLLFYFLKNPSRRSVGGKWETQPRFPSGPRPRLFHNQTNPHTLDKTDSRSASLPMTKGGSGPRVSAAPTALGSFSGLPPPSPSG